MTSYDVVVVGLGPAGLGFAKTIAASATKGSLLLVERGKKAADRTCTVLRGKGCRIVSPCEIIAGVGGAALLSGGKISGYPAGRGMTAMLEDPATLEDQLRSARSELQRYVPLVASVPDDAKLKEARREFSSKGLNFRYYDARRYKQTDLVAGFDRMLNEITDAGHSAWLGASLVGIKRRSKGFDLAVERDGKIVAVECKTLVLANGRHAHKVLDGAKHALPLVGNTKRTDVGVRLEFPTKLWPEIDAVHNDLKLEWGNARTYCVCKDGSLAPYWTGGVFLTEGYSDLDISTGLTNLAVVVRISENIFEEVRSRQKSRGTPKPLRQTLPDFLANRRNESPKAGEASITHWEWGDVGALFPDEVATQVRQAVAKLAGAVFPPEALSQVSVYGPEMDHYWPSYEVGRGFRTTEPGLYLLGDATGQFRGILQAFASGILCAQTLLREAQ